MVFFHISSVIRICCFFIAALCALCCADGSACRALAAQEGGIKSMNTSGNAPWTLNADNLVSLDDGVIVEATGGVLLQRGTDYLKADLARYYTTTNWVFVKGNVEVRMGRDMLKASEAEFDLTARTGWLKDGSVFIAGPHMYVKGEKVDKLHGDRYVFKKAKVTTCDGDTPAWSLATDSAEVEIDGYATLSHATVNILDVPLLDAPWLVLPAKTTRQTGLLFPDFGYSSLNGAFYSQPFFQVIDQSRDLTWTGTYMGKVGFMPSVEYRSHPSRNEKTWLSLDFLYDTHTFSTESGDPVNSSDHYVNTSKSRYWLRGMSNGEIGGSGWQYRYNLDYVSDQNFLRQFKNMHTGFDRTFDATYDMFGRYISEVDHSRVSEGYIYKEWDRFTVSLGARYNQRPYFGHGNIHHSQDNTVQRIPLNAWLYKGRVSQDFPLEVQGQVSAAYEYRRKGVRGLRTEIHPELTMPVALPGFSMLVNGGIRQTLYHSSHYSPETTNVWTRGSGRHSRFIPDMSVTAFTQLSRTWDFSNRALPATEENVGEWKWTGLKHRIQPKIEYSWMPDKDQSDNPYFESSDRLIPTQTIRVGATNIITGRRSSVAGKNGVYESHDTYVDPLRWELTAGYDIDEAHRTKFIKKYSRRPMLDTYSSLEFRPADWLNLWNRLYVSMYGDGITRSDTGVTLSNARWGRWSLSYSQRNRFYQYVTQMKSDSEKNMSFTREQRLLTNTFYFRPLNNISLHYLTTENLVTGKNYERRFTIGYHHQCFNILGAIHSKGRDNSYRIILQLPGLNF